MEHDIESDIEKVAAASAAAHGSTTAKIVLAKLLGSRPDLRGRAAEVMPVVEAVVARINAMDPETLASHKPERGRRPQEHHLPPLEGAVQGGVVTRFPPEPNGYPHVGHAKAAIISHEYAKMYGGRIILRMDDTNPAAERLEFYAAIKVGLDWLGIKFDHIKNTSDDMDTLHDMATRLVRDGKAYVCTCDRQTASENRRAMVPCRCRSRGMADNLSGWKDMQEKCKPGEAILRYMGDMKSSNTVMRDPVLFRVSDDRHPILEHRYRTWPSYDLAIAVEDSLDGVTHAFRSKEYELRSELYHSIQDSLGLRKPHMAVFSRLSLKDLPVSKRLIRPLLERGHIAGYDDPRLPTLAGLKRRGIQPEAVRKFVLSLGFTKSDTQAPFQTLESYNRTFIDPHSIRLHMVRDPVRFTVLNLPDVSLDNRQTMGVPVGPLRSGLPPGMVSMPELPNTRERPPDLSTLPHHQELVRTLDAAHDILVESADRDMLEREGHMRLIGLGAVTQESPDTLSYTPQSFPDIHAVHWAPADSSVPIRVLVPHPPFRGETFDENSLEPIRGMVEPHYTKIPDGSMVQFVRFGYARKESARQAVFTHK